MSLKRIFPKQPILPAVDLPLTLITLEDWIIIKVSGEDVIQFLHNQLTCDVQKLHNYQYKFSAHCHPNGKMISNMYIFHLNAQEMAFIERTSIYEQQIAEMKKYAVFNNVTIIPDHNATLLGIAGSNARKYLSLFFSVLPNKTRTIIHNEDVIILYFELPIERFLLIIKNQLILTNLLHQSTYIIKFNNSLQWMALDIEANYPIIEPITSGIFIPQAVNMDILHGINFHKGCYIGQEPITRIQYRGNNKQKLYRLISIIQHNNKTYHQLPQIGNHLELNINNQYWKQNVGVILQSCNMKNHEIWIQAVLNISLSKSSKLRITEIKDSNIIFVQAH